VQAGCLRDVRGISSRDLPDIQHWLQAMSNDPKFIFRAASFANKTVDYLLSFAQTPVVTTEPSDELVLV